MINILGINIAAESKQEILNKISSFLSTPPEGRGRYIVTPNPEFLLTAKKDEEFFFILNHADIAVPDGTGLVLAALMAGQRLKRISGIDLMLDICQLASTAKKSIYLLGGVNGGAKKAAKKLQTLFPNLNIVGAESGLKPGDWNITNGRWVKGLKDNEKLVARINKTKPDVIFVALGHSRQEKWIYHNLDNLKSAKLLMGVGGSFDFISGAIKRAPKFLRAVGLEWLWRLTQEPAKRLPRIIDAVIRFPLTFFKWKFISPWFYRPNIVCLLYKKESGKIKVLLAERREDKNHWQLPQGGTDGEDLGTAGSRELREEIGADQFKAIATFKNLYRYKFIDNGGSGNIMSHGVKASQIMGYKGQKQSLFIAEFTGADSDITINFWDHTNWKWADLDKVVDEVHEIRKEATNIFIEKFKSIL